MSLEFRREVKTEAITFGILQGTDDFYSHRNRWSYLSQSAWEGLQSLETGEMQKDQQRLRQGINSMREGNFREDCCPRS